VKLETEMTEGIDVTLLARIRSTTPLNVESFLNDSAIWSRQYTGLYSKICTIGDVIARSAKNLQTEWSDAVVQTRIDGIFEKLDNCVRDDADITELDMSIRAPAINKTLNATMAHQQTFDQSQILIRDDLDKGIFEVLSKLWFLSDDYLGPMLRRLNNEYQGLRTSAGDVKKLRLKSPDSVESEEQLFNKLLEFENISQEMQKILETSTAVYAMFGEYDTKYKRRQKKLQRPLQLADKRAARNVSLAYRYVEDELNQIHDAITKLQENLAEALARIQLYSESTSATTKT